jgi:hypothetical protein
MSFMSVGILDRLRGLSVFAYTALCCALAKLDCPQKNARVLLFGTWSILREP